MNDDFTSALAVEDDGPVESPAIAVDTAPVSPIGYNPLAQYYGYDQPNELEAEKLSYVWEYFAEQGQGPGETLETLRDLERSLSKPELGQSRLDKLYSYIRLVRASNDMNAELRAYMR